MKKQKTEIPIESLGLAAPAVRALHGAGYTHLEQLAKVREADIKPLHGMGPNALKKIGAALQKWGLAFKP